MNCTTSPTLLCDSNPRLMTASSLYPRPFGGFPVCKAISVNRKLTPLLSLASKFGRPTLLQYPNIESPTLMPSH